MIPELGHFALILALGISILLAIVPMTGAVLGYRRWVALAIPASIGQLLFIAITSNALKRYQ